MIRITDEIAISEDEISEHFVRASGPALANTDSGDMSSRVRSED